MARRPRTDADLDEIAAELYALAPGSFTTARNARAAMAPALAGRIKAWRKPTAAAWAVDALVRAGGMADALELGASLREAQDDLDAAELQRLGRQRRALVQALAGQAAALADEAGVAISPAARTDIEKTINAAMVDAASAAAVATARLVRALDPSGVDARDLADAVAGSVPGLPEAPARDDLAERRARRDAEKAAREADRAAGEAERERDRLDARVRKARERVDLLGERVDDLRAQLAHAEREADAARAELADAEPAARAASETARTARAAADRARAAAPGERG